MEDHQPGYDCYEHNCWEFATRIYDSMPLCQKHYEEIVGDE